MEKGKVLEQLLPELSSFLEIIDQEPLGTTARRKQQLIQTFIQQLKSSSGDDGEYMYMNSISPTLKTLIAERASASANAPTTQFFFSDDIFEKAADQKHISVEGKASRGNTLSHVSR